VEEIIETTFVKKCGFRNCSSADNCQGIILVMVRESVRSGAGVLRNN
jgi:type IV secretory pathway VirB6-like protein